jgi:Flp pilus assembly protein TadB
MASPARKFFAVTLIAGCVVIGFAGIELPRGGPAAVGIAFVLVGASLFVWAGVLFGRRRYKQTGDLWPSVGHGMVQMLKALAGSTPTDRPER